MIIPMAQPIWRHLAGRSWKEFLGGLISVLLLLPVPIYAFRFVGSGWIVTASSNATLVSTTDPDFDVLATIVGNSASLTAHRRVILSGKETFTSIADSTMVTLNGATYSVTESVSNNTKGSVTVSPAGFLTVGSNQFLIANKAGGSKTVTLTITVSITGTGWSTSSSQSSITDFTFQ